MTTTASHLDTSTAAKAVNALRAHASYMESLRTQMDEINLAIFHAETNGWGDFALISTGYTLGYSRDLLAVIDRNFNEAIDTLLRLQKCDRYLRDIHAPEANAYWKMLGRPGISGHARLRILADAIEYRCL